MTDNPYKILGLEPGADEDEIKKKYRSLVKQYHPDLHPGDEAAAQKMSEINAAYEQIKSGNTGPAVNSYNGSPYAPHGTYTEGETTYHYQYADVEDILRAFFGYGFASSASAVNIEQTYERIQYYIDNGDISNAAAILNRISNRDARWYYYASLISEEMGNYSDAVRFADQAASYGNSPEYAENAGRLHKCYDRVIRRRRIIPRLLSAVTTILVLSFIARIFSAVFLWWL